MDLTDAKVLQDYQAVVHRVLLDVATPAITQFKWADEVIEVFLDDLVALGQRYETIRAKSQDNEQEEDPDWPAWFPMKWLSDFLHKKNTLFPEYD